MSSPQRVTSSQQQTRISASSATRELDELMASLSDLGAPRSPPTLPCLLRTPQSSPPVPQREWLGLHNPPGFPAGRTRLGKDLATQDLGASPQAQDAWAPSSL